MPLADPMDYGNSPGNGPLRVGGSSVKASDGNANLPSTPSPAVSRMLPSVTMMRDLWSGSAKVRAEGEAYLPKAPAERPSDYRTRLERSVFVNFTRRTIEGIVGFMFREDIALGDDVPPVIQQHAENVDNAGTHLDVFVRDLVADAQTTGHAGIVVDYPNLSGVRLTLADEQAAKVRPYWVPIKKENILSWRVAYEQGRPVLTQLVLRELVTAPVGEFGEAEEERYRVFTRTPTANGPLVAFRLLMVTPDNKIVELDAGTYPTQVEIPFVEMPTSGKRAFLESDPPLLDVGYLNVAHYQVMSDYLTSMHMTAVPVFFTAGFQMTDPATGAVIEIGPNSGLNSPSPDAKAAYVSHDGAALGAQKTALDDLKADIGALGLAMLAPASRGVETAEAKRLDKSGQDSAIAVTARAAQDAVERALAFHARYLRLESGGSVTISREYENPLMDAATMQAYAVLADKLGIPDETILVMLQQGGRIPEDADIASLGMVMASARMAREDAADMAAEAAKQDAVAAAEAVP